jgi:branched-chain amino acid transport system permease protein
VIYAVALGIAGATIALAGVFNGAQTQFAPADGPLLLIYAFEAVVIGGLGSLWGTLAGGVILGVAQTIGAEIDPGWKQLVGHLVFLAFLVVRPTGLFGSKTA